MTARTDRPVRPTRNEIFDSLVKRGKEFWLGLTPGQRIELDRLFKGYEISKTMIEELVEIPNGTSKD